MDDRVVVTLHCKGCDEDYELPCNVPLSELYPRLLSALQKHAYSDFCSYKGIILELNNRGLTDLSATLMDYGICDGSVLSVAKEEKYYG